MNNQLGLVRGLMALRGLSQEKLAEAIGKHQPYVSDILTGKRTPTPADLKRICQALGIRPELITQ